MEQQTNQTTSQQQGCCSPDGASCGCGKTWLIVVIMIAAFVAGGLIYAWQQKSVNSILRDLQTQIINLQNQVMKKTPPATVTPTPDTTADWKTYTDSISNFSVSYPENWIIEEVPVADLGMAKSVLIIKNLPMVDVVGNNGPKTKEGSLFKVRTFGMAKAQTIQEQINSYDLRQDLKQERISQIITMNIAGENREVWPGNGLSNWEDIFEFTSGKIDYQIGYMSGSPEQFQADSTAFQKMLDSFKLTN